jgi:hypothetical protein
VAPVVVTDAVLAAGPVVVGLGLHAAADVQASDGSGAMASAMSRATMSMKLATGTPSKDRSNSMFCGNSWRMWPLRTAWISWWWLSRVAARAVRRL